MRKARVRAGGMRGRSGKTARQDGGVAAPLPAPLETEGRLRHFHASDWHGFACLLLEAAEGAIAIGEEIHGNIAATLPPLGPAGIAGFAWRRARIWLELARHSSEAPQEKAAGTDALPTPARRTVLAVLNGLVGDRLAASGNPLSIDMQIFYGGIALPLDKGWLEKWLPQPGERLVLLAHGLCQCDLQWRRRRHDHGAALQRDLGMAPLYLSYNSGLHVSHNGRELAVLLEALLREWPVPVRTLTLIGYSMGGLVLRSACLQGQLAGHAWVGRVDSIVFLGTPHHGTPLARGANWLGAVLGRNRLTAPFLRLVRLRSAGIGDLRHGSLLDEERRGDTVDCAHDRHRPAPLPQGVRCHAIAATLGARVGDMRDRLLGDGLVPVNSALGRHADPALRLEIPDEYCWILHRSHHLDLLGSVQVYRRIRAWLARRAR